MEQYATAAESNLMSILCRIGTMGVYWAIVGKRRVAAEFLGAVDAD